MIKRTLYFTGACHLSIRDQQLIITPKGDGEEKSAVIEDTGFIIIEDPSTTISIRVLQLAAMHNIAVIVCDERHHPASMLLHLDTHHIQGETFGFQARAPKAMKNQLWQQTIKAKIRNQGLLLKKLEKQWQPMAYLQKQVLSGDTTNIEGRAARHYWKELLGEDFRRDREGEPPNNLLNYGYTILRAAVARALTGSGLLPTFGIHHKNRYNSYPLADDIMEPYRPFIDYMVYQFVQAGDVTQDVPKEKKVAFLSFLASDIYIHHERSPFMVGLTQTTASLARCFRDEGKKITYPDFQM